MNGGAGPLDGAAELEGQDAQNETQQGDGQADLGRNHECKDGLVENKDVKSLEASQHHCFFTDSSGNYLLQSPPRDTCKLL